MIVKFNNPYLKKLYDDKPVKKLAFSKELVIQFKKTVLRLKQVDNSQQLRQFRGLNFEALKGDKKGLHSVRVNQQYRLEFQLENDNITLVEVVLIEELSKHYE